MDIQNAIKTLEGVADDLENGVLGHTGDIVNEDYAFDMLREPAEIARGLLGKGNAEEAASVARTYLEHVALDLENGLLESLSDDFSSEDYLRTVIRSALDADEPAAPTP